MQIRNEISNAAVIFSRCLKLMHQANPAWAPHIKFKCRSSDQDKKKPAPFGQLCTYHMCQTHHSIDDKSKCHFRSASDRCTAMDLPMHQPHQASEHRCCHCHNITYISNPANPSAYLPHKPALQSNQPANGWSSNCEPYLESTALKSKPSTTWMLEHTISIMCDLIDPMWHATSYVIF